MKRNLTPIASGVALFLMGAALSVQAQEAADANVQTVTTVGIRASLQQSLNQKKVAQSHVEVLTAEDVGKMPDKNVADSLQRLPGVTISSAGANEGGFDENDRVSMRGTNPSLTQTLVNGHGIGSGDWFVLNQGGSVGRSVSYSLMPSEIISRVVVHKTSEASLVEGGTAGSVDIITRKPLEFKKPLSIEAAIGLVYADLPRKTDPQANALINWKNDSGTFGMLVQAFYEKRHLRRDGQEILGYNQFAAGSVAATAHPDLAGVYYPVLIGSALFEQQRKRKGGVIDFQIKPTNDLSFNLDAFSSQMDAPNYNRNYMMWGVHFAEGQSPDAGYVVRNNTLVSANYTGVAGTQYGIYDQISRPDANSSSKYVNLDANWRVSDALTMSGQIGTTTGHGRTPTQDVAEWDTAKGTGAGWHLNGVDSAADWNLGSENTTAPTAGVTGLDWIFGNWNIDALDKETYGKIDGEFALGSGLFNGLKFGYRHTNHERSLFNVLNQRPALDGSAFNAANYPTPATNYPDDFASGLGGNFPRTPWMYTADQVGAFDAGFAYRPTDNSRHDFTQDYSVKEKTDAGYVQGDFAGEGFSGNLGVRLVKTKTTIDNFQASGPNIPGAITTSLFGTYVPVETENNYTDILPSLNMKFNVSKDMVARFALSKTMTRPDYSALANSIGLDTIGFTGTGSNPNLKPIRSNNLDLTLEYYFAPRALASVSYFMMDLTSYVGLGKTVQNHNYFTGASNNVQNADFLMTVPVNTRAKVDGLEFGYEMPIGSNFGIQANYTYVDANEIANAETLAATTNFTGAVVGASKNTGNLTGYFENDMFNARLTYSYRSSFYSGLDRSTAFSQAAVGDVSASLGWKISDNLALSFDARNLNDPKLKYFALNEDQPRSIYRNGRQYFLMLHAKM